MSLCCNCFTSMNWSVTNCVSLTIDYQSLMMVMKCDQLNNFDSVSSHENYYVITFVTHSCEVSSLVGVATIENSYYSYCYINGVVLLIVNTIVVKLILHIIYYFIIILDNLTLLIT